MSRRPYTNFGLRTPDSYSATADHSPSHRMTSSTSKGYFISPSTNPGESTNVTRLNRFCRDVQISVLRYSETPRNENTADDGRLFGTAPTQTTEEITLKAYRLTQSCGVLFIYYLKHPVSLWWINVHRVAQRGIVVQAENLTFEVLQWLEVWIEMKGGISLKKR